MRAAIIGVLAAALAVAAAQAAERPVRSRLCPEDLPEGARLPPQPGCDGAARASGPLPARGAGDGFRDLGDGTSVRIGGRIGAEFGGRR